MRRATEPLAVFGHQPFLGKLASLAVAGDENADVIHFTMGGLVCLVPRESGDAWRIAWALSPDLA